MTRTAARASCEHEGFAANVAVTRIEDRPDCYQADVRIECTQCGEPFRFLGLPHGLSFTAPMLSADGLELRAPIEPEGKKRIATKASFHMPHRMEEA